MEYYSKKKRLRRQEQERKQSMIDFTAHKEEKEEYEMFYEACTIISTLSRISYTARSLTADDILEKIENRAELDFYYKWCSKI